MKPVHLFGEAGFLYQEEPRTIFCNAVPPNRGSGRSLKWGRFFCLKMARGWGENRL